MKTYIYRDNYGYFYLQAKNLEECEKIIATRRGVTVEDVKIAQEYCPDECYLIENDEDFRWLLNFARENGVPKRLIENRKRSKT